MERRFFSRELSWLDFNDRVFEEAQDDKHPLLERVKFLSIVHSNLDEFFMIRVSGLQEQVESGLVERTPDGYTAREQLIAIRARAQEMLARAHACFTSELTPLLAAAGLTIADLDDLAEGQREPLDRYFDEEVYPVLTPLAVDPGHPFPHISNLSLSLAVVLRDPDGIERFARVKIPEVLPRFVLVPSVRSEAGSGKPRRRKAAYTFTWLEQLIAARLPSLFTGMEVVASYPFRVVRDADLEIREDEAGDLLQQIEAGLRRRRFGSVSQLSVGPEMPEAIRSLLVRNLGIDVERVYEVPGPLGMSDLMSMVKVELPGLHDRPFRPSIPAALRDPATVFESVRRQDILVHHPFDSFTPIVDLVRQASKDPSVLAIKQTIYRVGSNSPIVEALAEAAVNGKQVSVLVELKARFDEENNIEWARALERAGAHVVYGDVDLKTHCKVLLIVRREGSVIRRYVHIGTGNYNERTAALYTDLGLLTCDVEIADDVTALFNTLTGYSISAGYRKLLVSPGGIRQGLFDRIEREIAHAQSGRGGHLIFKTNSLTDFKSAEMLYRASQAGVKVDLIVRGSCCLVPGRQGLSDNIRVISVVGRFLEHSRVYYFRNGDEAASEVWLGSADLMPRNLDRRVETLFPLRDRKAKRLVVGSILRAYLRDCRQARELQPNGRYVRLQAGEGESSFGAQEWFICQSEEPHEEIQPVETPAKRRRHRE